jgi:hypothetical protein
MIVCHEPDAPPMPSRGLERRRRIIDRLREDGIRLTQVYRGHQLRRMQAAGKAYLAMMERANDGSWAMGWALSSIYDCVDLPCHEVEYTE